MRIQVIHTAVFLLLMVVMTIMGCQKSIPEAPIPPATSFGCTPPACTPNYAGPNEDIQRDAFCQQAHLMVCVQGMDVCDPQVQDVCDTYNGFEPFWTGSPWQDCPYCP